MSSEPLIFFIIIIDQLSAYHDTTATKLKKKLYDV